MADRKLLMPKATAVWLVENTSLTFEQVAAFCNMHLLEVKGIADGDVAAGIKGMDPITSGQLTREEIKRAEDDDSHKLRLADRKLAVPVQTKRKGPRFTPSSQRQERPNAVLWLIRNHPELRDSQIIRLVGTTKPTIAQIRNRQHWNSPNLVAMDPVTLGMCSQIDLDAEVQKSAKRVPGARDDGATLLPTAETTTLIQASREVEQPPAEVVLTGAETHAETRNLQRTEEQAMLAKLKGLTGEKTETEPTE